MAHSRRKMKAYGEREHGGHYVLDNYEWSRNHHKAVSIRRWKRDLKSKARAAKRVMIHKARAAKRVMIHKAMGGNYESYD